jgi:soluble lytic murein transglycosylase-like protein
VESYGAWGLKLKEFFNNMISAAAEYNTIDNSYVKNYWIKRISMAIQKGIANAVNTRVYSLRAGGEARRDESIEMT